MRDKSNPDFSNGFVEVYKDPRGQKGAIQGFVSVVDEKMNRMMTGFWPPMPVISNSTLRGTTNTRIRIRSRPIVNATETVVETGAFRGKHHRRQSAERRRDSRKIRIEELHFHGIDSCSQ